MLTMSRTTKERRSNGRAIFSSEYGCLQNIGEERRLEAGEEYASPFYSDDAYDETFFILMGFIDSLAYSIKEAVRGFGQSQKQIT